MLPAAAAGPLPAIPSAGQCLMLAAPFLALWALFWLWNHIDGIIRHFFPGLQWQKELGWLNIQAERRAATVLRWLGYLVQAGLVAALYGIVWGAIGLRELNQWSDPDVLRDLCTRLPVLVLSLGVCLLYLLAELLPRMRREYEQEELERFRALTSVDEESDEKPARFGAAWPPSAKPLLPAKPRPGPRSRR